MGEPNEKGGIPAEKIEEKKENGGAENIQAIEVAFTGSGTVKQQKAAKDKWNNWKNDSNFSLDYLREKAKTVKPLNKILKDRGIIETKSTRSKKKNVKPEEIIQATTTRSEFPSPELPVGKGGPFFTADENIKEKSVAPEQVVDLEAGARPETSPEPVPEPAPVADPANTSEAGSDSEKNTSKIQLTSKEFHNKYGHIFRETLFKEEAKGKMISASWKTIESYNAKKGEVKLSGFSMTKDGFTGIKYVPVEKLDEELDGFELKINEKKEPIAGITKKEFYNEFRDFFQINLFKGDPKNNDFIYAKEYDDKSGSVKLVGSRISGLKSLEEFRKLLEQYKPEENEEVDKLSPEELKEIERRNKAVLDAADYTFSKMDEKDVSQLNTPTADESDKIFIEKTRKLWKEFAAHGVIKDRKVITETDLDGQAFLKFLELAGFKIEDVKYVDHDKPREGGITGDAGGEHGVVLKINGEEYSLIIDHHADESKRDSSTAKFTYKLLVDYGLLKEDELYNKFVDYVTLQDNQTYSKDEVKDLFNSKNDKKRFTNKYARTIMGLQKNLNADQILELLKEVKDFRKDELPKEVLENYKVKDKKTGEEKTLLEFSLEAEKKMNIARKEIIAMDKNGSKISTGRDQHGDVLVDTGKLIIGDADNKELYFPKVPSGWRMLPARASGYGAYVLWLPEIGKVQVYTEKPLGDIKFSKEGVNVRGNYWFYNGEEGEKLPPEMLEEIITKLSGKEYKMGGELKEAMEKEEKPREEIRAYARQAADIKEKIWDIFNPKKFTKDRVGEEIEGEAKKIEANLREIIFGQIGKNKKFKNWPEKIEAFREAEKTVSEFISRVEGNKKETAQETGELLEKELKAIDKLYIPVAREYFKELEEHFANLENSSDIKDVYKKRYWEHEIYAKMSEHKKIREEKIPAAIELVKKSIEEKEK